MKATVGIPSIGLSPYIADLLAVCLASDQVSEVLVYDNSPERGQPALDRAFQSPFAQALIQTENGRGRFMYRRRKPEWTIYDSWNEVLDVATAKGEATILLNDDVILCHGALEVALSGLEAWDLVGFNYAAPAHVVDPTRPLRQVTGTYRTGGFGGFAFAVRPDWRYRVGAGYRWWFGDDDLAERIKSYGGGLAVHMGAPVEHPLPSLSGNQQTWTQQAATEDTHLFRRNWPNAR